MLWLCLRFPLLPLEVFAPAILAENGALGDVSIEDSRNHPAAVVERHRILVCNQAAIAAGIKPGTSLTTARALCSAAMIFDRKPLQEAQILQTLAYSCYRFTPAISIQPPDCLLLEIGGCLKLFKGLGRLLTILTETISGLGHAHSTGLALTPKAATLLSRVAINAPDNTHEANSPAQGSGPAAGASFDQISCFDNLSGALHDPQAFNQHLDALPLSILDCPAKLKAKFRSTGFHCLGDLLHLPGAAIGKRYGKDFLVYLKQLSGELPDPQQALELPPQFASELHFNDGITATQMLAFPIKRLLLALCGYLHGRQLHCSKISWRLHLVGGKTDELNLHFTQPHNHLEHFLSMSRLKLENRALSAPVESLSLHVTDLHLAEQNNNDLFDPQGNTRLSSSMAVVLDKLRTRLGENTVHALCLADSHIPEQAWQTTEFVGAPVKAPAAASGSNGAVDDRGYDSNLTHNRDHTAAMHRPLWLLQTPEPIQQRGQGLYWRGELELLQGPERIEGNWWQQAICRDYFIARHHSGALHWVYQDRLSAAWFIHGTFG